MIEGKSIDARIDLFAAGLVLYSALTLEADFGRVVMTAELLE